ncbi:MAG: DUF2782 domain-containing protein [Gammaproteobacteria bacterium]
MTVPTSISMTLRSLLLLGLWFIIFPANAQDNLDEQPAIEDELSPSGQVTIKGDNNEVISEFRINGQLYMIRITPNKGVPYYLVDADGDGNLETRWNELAPDLLIPAWVLLRW